MGKKISGIVQSGINNAIGLNNYLVKLYSSDVNNAQLLGTAHTGENGQFTITVCKKHCNDYKSILYLTAYSANIKLLYIITIFYWFLQ